MSFDELLNDLDARERRARSMGGEVKLARRRDSGVLNARERIERLLDPGTFIEEGLLGVSSVMPEDRDSTPSDGKVTGFGKIMDRCAAVVSNDFTVKGASSSLTNMKKIAHMKRVATERGMPLIFLGESSGARLPDNMGSRGMGTLLGNDPSQYVRQRETPWVSAVLGPCYGSAAWYSCLSDFVVMRKGAVLAVASPQLASLAMGEAIEAEELGGWQLHSTSTGLVDAVVDTDEEALALIRKFLSYLPANREEAPPRIAGKADDTAMRVLEILPESRKRGYDVRRILKAILDCDSLFELKPDFGRVVVTALGRLDGRVVGVIANNPMYKAGALDVSACEKITSLLVLCDSFNIPLLLFVDTPGFAIGKEAERQRAPAKIMNQMAALQLFSMPKFSVILRKSYGQAYLNMGGGRNSDEILAWPMAEVSFMEAKYAAKIVLSGKKESVESEAIRATEESMQKSSAVWDLAESCSIHAVIHPNETRQTLARLLDVYQSGRGRSLGRHQLANWPYRH